MSKNLIPSTHIEQCPKELPEWLAEALKTIINRNIIIYKKGNMRARCHVCGEMISSAPNKAFYQHQTAVCPNCRKESTCYIEASSHETACVQGVFSFAQRGLDGKTVFIRQFKLLRPRDADYSHPIDSVQEVSTYAFLGRDARKWNFSKYVSRFYDTYPYGHFFEQGAAEVFAGTVLEHCGWHEYAASRRQRRVIDFLRAVQLYPTIEHLHKRGYDEIVHEKVIGGKSREINEVLNLRAKSKKTLFRVPMEIVSAVPRDELTIEYLQSALALRKRRIPTGECIKLLKLGIDRNFIDTAAEYTTEFRRLKRYLLRQGKNIILRDWADYMRDCSLLGYAIAENDVLFPRNFKAAHFETSQEVIAHKNKVEAAKRTENERKYAARVDYLTAFCLTANEFLIRPCASREEMKAEGEKLHHCVGTYFDNAANGHTNIMLIRESTAPEKPFYTIEVRITGQKIKVLQCRGLQNKNMTDEVQEFVKIWEKHATKTIKKMKEYTNERSEVGTGNQTHVA